MCDKIITSLPQNFSNANFRQCCPETMQNASIATYEKLIPNCVCDMAVIPRPSAGHFHSKETIDTIKQSQPPHLTIKGLKKK